MINYKEIVDLLIQSEEEYIYLYESHMGGVYATKEPKERLQCIVCGDSDNLIDQGNREELLSKYWDKLYKNFKLGTELIRKLGIRKTTNDLLLEYEIEDDGTECSIFEECYSIDNFNSSHPEETLRTIIFSKDIPFTCKECLLNDILESVI